MSFQLTKRPGKDFKTSYRPQTLDEVVPTFPISRLKKIAKEGVAGQVYLFEGPTGVGKTTVARILGNIALGREDIGVDPLGITEINVANFRKIDDIRELVESFQLCALRYDRRVIILDEVHQLTNDSQQLLLKALEEPPAHIVVFLCTTETKGLKKTLVDRALTVHFRRMSREQAVAVIDQVLAIEEKTVDPVKRPALIDAAQGSVRALLNNLEAALDGDFDVESFSEDGPAEVPKLASALMSRDWPQTAKILQSDAAKNNPEALRIGVENYLRAIVLKQKSTKACYMAAVPLSKVAGTLTAEPKISQYNMLVLRCLRACDNAGGVPKEGSR